MHHFGAPAGPVPGYQPFGSHAHASHGSLHHAHALQDHAVQSSLARVAGGAGLHHQPQRQPLPSPPLPRPSLAPCPSLCSSYTAGALRVALACNVVSHPRCSGCVLFITGLAPDATADSLFRLFSLYGCGCSPPPPHLPLPHI